MDGKHTKGLVTTDFQDAMYVRAQDGSNICIMGQLTAHGRRGADVSAANARLIADAFNVATETGLTPRQLLSQRDALREALQRARDDLNHLAFNIAREDGDGMTRVGAGEFAQQSCERADAALSKDATDGGVKS